MIRHTCLGAAAVVALASSVHAEMLPVRWDIQASFFSVIGELPAGPFANMDDTWVASLSLTIATFEEVIEPEANGPAGDPFFRPIFDDDFELDVHDADLDGYLLIGAGSDIDGSYLPRNFDTFDSADTIASDLPIQFDRGEEAGDETFDLRFGFNGPADTFTEEDPFLLAPNLDDLFGTGFILEFSNGARAFGEIDVWDTTFIPTPGAPALLAMSGFIIGRRRR